MPCQGDGGLPRGSGIRLFDYPRWAEPLHEEIRASAERLALYEAIVRTAAHVVNAEHVARFLGHKVSANDQGKVGNDFFTRI